MQLAPVEAQISLAKEIGTNEGYQRYLISIRQIEAGQAVGTKQAEALVAAEVKIISNTGTPVEGANSVMSLFTPQGGLQLGAMLEAFTQTDAGKNVVGALKPKPQAEK
jgi:flotillin